MTLNRPTITLSRLVVTKAGRHIFDKAFHSGLNVIRGENGSGKTTIADFLFFALGGDTPSWRAEAATCDYVYAEVAINGELITVRREIESAKLRPMAVFWGNFQEAQSSGSEWQLFPYAANQNRESFSQVLFRAAAIPEVKGELSGRITLHQVLRLIYVDQRTDYEQLFRADPFDQHLTREAVGDLLCGVYDDHLYDSQLQLSGKIAEKAALQAELKAIYTLLGDQAVVSAEWLAAEKAKLIAQREEAYAKLNVLRELPTEAPVAKVAERRVQIATELAQQNGAVHELQKRVSEARLESQDRQQFISALSMRLKALNESQSIHDQLGTFSFQFCPACYAPLGSEEGKCHLCKSTSEARAGQNVLHLRHELQQQIKESQSLQAKASDRLRELSQHLAPAIDKQHRLQLQYDDLSTAAYSSIDAAAAELHRTIGYIDRNIEDIEQRSRLAERTSALIAAQADVAAEISRLEDDVFARKAVQEETRHDAYDLIASGTVEVLKRDLPREEAFGRAAQVQFDFGANKLSVDGRSTFAASSNVYLKNAFHLALFQASTLRPYMRYPRLAIFDNVEDKGMEATRSHNFQRIVREVSLTTEVEHQSLLFTSMVAPEFEHEESLLVGPHYSHERKTLEF